MSSKAPSLLCALIVCGGLSVRAAQGQPIGGVDTPTAGQSVAGVVRVAGFVLDFNRVDKVELFVDGVFRNRAVTNLPRADVLEIFPTYAASATPNPGFVTSFNARTLSNGPHLLSVRVTESDNRKVFELASVSVTVTAANQAPFGNIDIPGSEPVEGANGSFPVVGWVLDDSGLVDHIDFLVDGQIVAGAVGSGLPSSAIYGTTRPDVFAAFPDVPNSLNSGFLANIDTTRFIDGVHIFSVRAFDREGASRVIGTRTVQVINNGWNLPPFGWLDFPLDKASIRCNDFPQDFIPGVPLSVFNNVVAGWALDVGSRLDKGQVSYVELLWDGVILANTRRDCFRSGNVLVNCYGVNRPDVARAYQGYVNADNSGFQFIYALQQNPDNGLIAILMPGPFGEIRLVGWTTSGKHTLSLRAGDEEETSSQFGAISVDLLCDNGPFSDRPAIGYIDTPSPYQFIKGIFGFSGWAFDPDNGGQVTGVNGIVRLDIDIDGQVVGSLYPPYISRPDLPANVLQVPPYPGVTPPTSFSGWVFNFDTARLSDSEHDLVVYAVDTPNAATGRPAFRTEIGRRKFVVFNNTGTKQ